MVRWTSSVLGALTFVIAHLIVWAEWRAWFQPVGAWNPWFLNSGRAVAFTAAMLFLVALVEGLRASAAHAMDPFGGGRSDAILAACSFAVGAVIAMAGVLILSGPGTLFPVALVIGGGIAFLSSVAGAIAGTWIRGRPARRSAR